METSTWSFCCSGLISLMVAGSVANGPSMTVTDSPTSNSTTGAGPAVGQRGGPGGGGPRPPRAGRRGGAGGGGPPGGWGSVAGGRGGGGGPRPGGCSGGGVGGSPRRSG